jgi:hypothetical protein
MQVMTSARATSADQPGRQIAAKPEALTHPYVLNDERSCLYQPLVSACPLRARASGKPPAITVSHGQRRACNLRIGRLTRYLARPSKQRVARRIATG